MSGVDLNTVREVLGHKTLDMTLRYSHLSPDHQKRVIDLLGQRIGSKVGTIWAQSENLAELSTESLFDNSLEHKELVDTTGP